MNTFSELVTTFNKGFDQLITEGGVRMGAMSKYISSACQAPINISDGSCVNRCYLGKYFNLGLYSYIADTSVGRYCSIASRVSIGAFSHPTDWLSVHEFSFRDTTSIWGDSVLNDGRNYLQDSKIHTTIGNDVWVGDNVVILRGVNIGDGAIIGAASVITKDVPPYAIMVGNPSRVVKFRFNSEIIEELLALKWWDMDMAELIGLDFSDINAVLKVLRTR